MNSGVLGIKVMKFRLKYFGKYCSPYYFTKILQHEGISVGDHTIFYSPESQTIDRQRPWMLRIGDFCKITKGTVILTHDYSRSVLRRVYGEVIGEASETIIGDNVFIGMNSIILMGAHIGNNVIIGAGSVVNGKIPDNCVAAGNPCRVIRTLDEHYKIRKSKVVEEAITYFNSYKCAYGCEPTVKEMNAFFSLFLPRDRQLLLQSGIDLNLNGDIEAEIIRDFMLSQSEFESFEEFKREAAKYIDGNE